MTWVLVIAVGWVLLAALVAVVIGRSVRLADEKMTADAAAEEPNFVVDPATSPRGMPAATVLPFPAPSAENGDKPPPPQATWDTPTVPGIPVARPPAPGARNGGGQSDPIRKTGLG